MRQLALMVSVAAACSDNLPPEAPAAASQIDGDPFSTLPHGAEQLEILCNRNLGDSVFEAFCASMPPRFSSLVELEQLLGLDFKTNNLENGMNGNPAFVLTGNSSSLSARSVSAVNPRAIIFNPPNRRGRVSSSGAAAAVSAGCPVIEPRSPLVRLVVLAFARGDNLVELASKDHDGSLNFYLLQLDRSGPRFTPESESGFTGYTLFAAADIKDTIFDCDECHQPAGPGTRKILRMQELRAPWAHFFRNNRGIGTMLLDDFRAAHGSDEAYAGIPGAVIFNADTTETVGLASGLSHSGGPDPAALEGLVENEGFCDAQYNQFNSALILGEVQHSNPLQPAVNVPKGTSSVWSSLYDAAKAGRAIPPPYHDVKVTDPQKLAAATRGYADYRAGRLSAEAVPDLQDVFLEDALPDLTFRPAVGLGGREILVQACGQCHNSRLDLTLSRARFRTDALEAMSREEKDLAIARLNLPSSSALHMPPRLLRELSTDELALVVSELQR